MKKLLMLTLIMISATAMSDESDQYQCKKKSDCEVVRVLTRCDVEKQKLRNQIYVLEKQVKELKQQISQTKETIVTETKTVERETVRHNVISVDVGPDVTSTSNSYGNNTATANASYGYVPGLMYQYQFDSGLVPGVGLNTSGHPSAYLGWGF